MSAEPAVATAPPKRDTLDTSARSVDWASLAPATVGEVVLDVIKVVVFALAIMHAWALWHHVGVTTNIAIGGAVAGLLVAAGWKTFLAVAEAYGTRVVGAVYFVVGVAICAAVLSYAESAESVTTSTQLRHVIHVLGLVFLYPAGLGLFAVFKGDGVAAVNPLGFPMSPRWFATLWVLFAKEVRTFFTTGMPYVIMFVFTGMNGFLFWCLILFYMRSGTESLPKPGEILAHNYVTILANIIIWPAITMRLVAEEKRMGTIETLLTVPVTDAQVIFAKYASAMAFYLVNLIPFLGYHVVLASYAKDWDWGPIFAEFLGMILWGGLVMSFGLFFSTLTDSQLVAFLLGAALNVVLFVLSLAEQFVKEDTVVLGVPIKAVAHYTAVNTHYMEFVKGIVNTQSLAFFLSFTALGIFASIRGLEAQRWK